ncbi:LVIVD repeat-containing protein [Granulosicoccus antarcticus]|uniref:LVIVD repeat-containing protein n=1 Tax=Granulosicoccus antarcticus IMCC3135 TaxID=1192854 RepID=A0A2Z2NZ45_9GAMM|nr:hypothetical protein [Granulosicoccus antarcticus]ASJ76726.1 hypothetical protein IMCC3135_33410 [Granulosicoccus antarcticus IMCC3135]
MRIDKLSPLVLTVLSASVLSLAGCNSDSSSGSFDGAVTGIGGSTARMTISGDYLYAISGSSVQLFDITAPEAPAPYTQVQVQWDIQTLFPYENYLLVGAASGLHILDNTDPASPQYVGDFTHARTVDPVVAKDGYAYVTLKRDTSLQTGGDIDNQMNVVDISDVTQPQLVETVSMQAPAGLSVEGSELYVCDGVAGLKTFDLSNPAKPEIANVLQGVDCLDVIAQDQRLYVIDDLGLKQYSTVSGVPVLLSSIDTKPVVYVLD